MHVAEISIALVSAILVPYTVDVGHPSMEKAIRAAKNKKPRTTFQPLSRRALNRYFEITKPVEEMGQHNSPIKDEFQTQSTWVLALP